MTEAASLIAKIGQTEGKVKAIGEMYQSPIRIVRHAACGRHRRHQNAARPLYAEAGSPVGYRRRRIRYAGSCGPRADDRILSRVAPGGAAAHRGGKLRRG